MRPARTIACGAAAMLAANFQFAAAASSPSMAEIARWADSAGIAVPKPPAAEIAAPVRSPLQSKVDELFKPLVDKGEVVGLAVGIVTPQGQQFFGYGETKRGNGLRPDSSTLFDIGSISKVFTSLALAREAVNGNLRLEDPVDSILPQGMAAPQKDGKKILLWHLATHSSGLPRLPTNLNPAQEDQPYADYGPEKLAEFLRSYSLPRAPGDQVEYSNLGAGLLGFALARRAGMDYGSFIQKEVVEPLGLKNTSLDPDPARLVQGYYKGDEVPAWRWTDVFAGAGGLRSDIDDLLRLAQAGMGSIPTPLDAAMRLSLEPRKDVDTAHGIAIGLGWFIQKADGYTFVGHNGSTYGCSSILLFDPKARVGLSVLANAGLVDLNRPAAILAGYLAKNAAP